MTNRIAGHFTELTADAAPLETGLRRARQQLEQPVIADRSNQQILTNARRPAPLRDHIERLTREAQSEEPIR